MAVIIVIAVKCRNNQEKEIQFNLNFIHFLSLVKGRLEAARSDEKPGKGTVCQFAFNSLYPSFLL